MCELNDRETESSIAILEEVRTVADEVEQIRRFVAENTTPEPVLYTVS